MSSGMGDGLMPGGEPPERGSIGDGLIPDAEIHPEPGAAWRALLASAVAVAVLVLVLAAIVVLLLM